MNNYKDKLETVKKYTLDPNYRWKKKNGLEDLKKAEWYLNHLIDFVKEKENGSIG